MPNILTPFGFVKKTGDIMTGDLNMQGNKLIFTGTGNDVSIKHANISQSISLAGPNGEGYAYVYMSSLTVSGNIAVSGMVDGRDVAMIGHPSGKLYLGTVQVNLVSGVETLVEIDTVPEQYTDGIEDADNHKVVPGVEGFYSIVAAARFENLIVNKCYKVALKISGEAASLNIFSPSDVGQPQGGVCVLPSRYLTDSDYLQLYVTSYAGVDTVDIAGCLDTCLEVQRVR